MDAPSENPPANSAPRKIGFPAGLLVDEPLRVDVLRAERGVFAAINKPADVLFDSYQGAPKQKSLVLAMRAQEGKSELLNLGVKSPYGVNALDFEYSGAALFAMDKQVATDMRNAMWSGLFQFRFLLLARAFRKGAEEFEIDLPMLMHEERPVWIVSHRFGKKAKTHFRLEASAGGYQMWSACTAAARPHQIRLHAAEAGLEIAGEWIYTKTPYVFLSKLKDGYKTGKDAAERALYPHLAVHLAGVKYSGAPLAQGMGETFEIFAPLPKGFSVMLKKIGFSPEQFRA